MKDGENRFDMTSVVKGHSGKDKRRPGQAEDADRGKDQEHTAPADQGFDQAAHESGNDHCDGDAAKSDGASLRDVRWLHPPHSERRRHRPVSAEPKAEQDAAAHQHGHVRR